MSELKTNAMRQQCPTCKAAPHIDCVEVGGETPGPWRQGVDTRIVVTIPLDTAVREYFDALDEWTSPKGGLGHQEARLNRAEDVLRKLVGREGEPCTVGNTRSRD